MGKAPCQRTQTLNNVPTSRGEKHHIYLITCTKWGLNGHGDQRQLPSVQLLSQSRQTRRPPPVSHEGGGPRVVVSTAAFHARVRGSVPGLGGLKETKLFLPHPRVKVSIVGSLRDREVACSASDRQGSNFESCVWRTVSAQSSHHPQEVLLAQFSLYVHKGGLKPDSFHFIFVSHELYRNKPSCHYCIWQPQHIRFMCEVAH